jgi:hypothetical protein
MGDEGHGPLVSFLKSAAEDHELHQQFMDRETPFSDLVRLLERHGWRDLSPDQQRLFEERRTLPKLQEAVEAELNGEDWPYDVSAHQHARSVIGPCWVLVRI